MEGGPPGFAPGFTCPALLGTRPRRGIRFAYGALTLFRRPSQAVPLRLPFVTAPPVSGRGEGRSHDTSCSNASEAYTCMGLGLSARSLAATSAVSVDFLSSGYLDVSVPRVAFSRPMGSGGDKRALPRLGSPIRRSAGRAGICP